MKPESTWIDNEMETLTDDYLAFVQERLREARKTCKDPVALIEAGILKNVRDGVRILGDGELTAKNLTVRAQGFTQSAAEKIAAAGGKVEVV